MPASAPTAAPRRSRAAGKTVAAPAAAAKASKPALVRDGFTMPADEYAVIAQLKQRALGAGHPAKKSEVLRAGLKLLAALDTAALLASLEAVPALKTGRPKAQAADPAAKAAKPKKQDKPEKPEKPEKPDKRARGAKGARAKKADKPAQGAPAPKPAKGAQAPKPAKGAQAPKPAIDAKPTPRVKPARRKA